MKHKENMLGHWRYVCGKNPNNQKLSPAKYVNVPKKSRFLRILLKLHKSAIRPDRDKEKRSFYNFSGANRNYSMYLTY